MIRVAVSGAGGKLAGSIIRAVSDAEDLELSALFNPNRHEDEIAGVSIVAKHAEVDADVVVETSLPSAVLDNLSAWRDRGLPTIVGTSGFTPERLEQLRGEWGEGSPCLVVPNFSVGAVLMMRFASEAASRFEAAEIVERHHAGKPDAPSGTALASAMGISEGGGQSVDGSDELVVGARGATVEGVRVHSLRLPGVISQQEIVLSNPGEVLSIEHLSTSYESFAAGALLAIRGVQALPEGVHLGLEAVL